MPGSPPRTSHKRQRSEPDEASQLPPPPPKRQNLQHTKALTKRALRELDRRNAQAVSRSTIDQNNRAITRSITRLKENHRRHQSSKHIRQFAKHGGPDLSHLRNYPPIQKMASRRPRAPRKRGSAVSSDTTTSETTTSTRNTSTTRSTGPYNRDFQQNLIDAGIFPEEYEYPDGTVPDGPTNEKAIREIIICDRASLSPSRFTEKEHYRNFKRAAAQTPKEKQVSETVLTTIEGRTADYRCRSGGIPFKNLTSLTSDILKPGNPDVYYGARPEQLNRAVRDELGKYIIPSTQYDLPIVPNFVLAAKGPDGSAAVAKRQACYDGAQGARAMHMLRSYKNDSPEYGDTVALSSTYLDGQLKLFTHHLAKPAASEDRTEYHMTQIKAWALTGDYDTCRDGLKAYRNARDWAAQQRNDAIEQANKRAAIEAGSSSSISSRAYSELALSSASDTSTCTVEPLIGPSQCPVREKPRSPSEGENDESEITTGELSQEQSRSKRASRPSDPTASARRKRRNAYEADMDPTTSSFDNGGPG